MIDPQKIEALSDKITRKLPPVLGDFKQETENTIKQVLQGFFAKLDLVTREEFDVQKAVLLKTRQKLEALEAQLKDQQK